MLRLPSAVWISMGETPPSCGLIYQLQNVASGFREWKQSCDLDAKSSLPQRLSPASLPPFLFIINAWGEEDQMPV